MSKVGNADQNLVKRIQRGDSAAIRELFDTHFSSLVDYAASFLRSTDAAEDLISDLFSWIITNPERFSPTQSIRAYLLWLVRNRALDVMRSAKREESRYSYMLHREDESIVPARPVTPGESAEASDEVSRSNTQLLAALDSLAPTARSIVLLRLRQGLEYPEIAQVVGLSETAVRMQLSRALRSLRDRLLKPQGMG